MKVFWTVLVCVSLLFTELYASEVDDKNWGAHEAPYQLNEYSRDGSTVLIERNLNNVNQIDVCNEPDVTCINANFSRAEARFNCSETSINGGWGNPIWSGQCWTSLEACYFYGTPSQTCYPLDGSIDIPENHSISVSSQCSSPDSKGLCLFENDGLAKIRSDTGDDMFAITHGASGYSEYPVIGSIGTEGRLTYMERDGGDLTRDLMIPSGPPASYSDYIRFTNNPPTFLTSEAGCYQLDVNLCQGSFISLSPVVVGACGNADENSYAAAVDVEAAGLCDDGNANPSSLTDPGPWNWVCEGKDGGADSPTCSAMEGCTSACCFIHINDGGPADIDEVRDFEGDVGEVWFYNGSDPTEDTCYKCNGAADEFWEDIGGNQPSDCY